MGIIISDKTHLCHLSFPCCKKEEKYSNTFSLFLLVLYTIFIEVRFSAFFPGTVTATPADKENDCARRAKAEEYNK